LRQNKCATSRDDDGLEQVALVTCNSQSQVGQLVTGDIQTQSVTGWATCD